MDALSFSRHTTDQPLEIGKCYKVNTYALAYVVELLPLGVDAYFLHHGKAYRQQLTYHNRFEPCELPEGYEAVITKINPGGGA